MFNIERQNEILSMLEKSGSMSVKELSQMLYVSPPTVRRDLDELQRHGRVIRTHGGVMLRETAEKEIPLVWREEQNNLSKKAIAKKAVSYIKNGDVLFLDASSTVSYLIELLRDFEDIIVITNSPKSSMRLGAANIKNYCTGGLLLNHSVAYVGSEAEKFVASFNADIFFFSSRAAFFHYAAMVLCGIYALAWGGIGFLIGALFSVPLGIVLAILLLLLGILYNWLAFCYFLYE